MNAFIAAVDEEAFRLWRAVVSAMPRLCRRILADLEEGPAGRGRPTPTLRPAASWRCSGRRILRPIVDDFLAEQRAAAEGRVGGVRGDEAVHQHAAAGCDVVAALEMAGGIV
jgi:hypothetical protein